MTKADLRDFFELKNNDDLFKHAINPKSCGGGEEFKMLALLGDRILNLELFHILSDEGITDSGTMTKRINNYIHNEDILYLVGKMLKIDDLMSPMDFKHKISKNELKESVEALIGANFKAHGFGPHKKIIGELYEKIKKIEAKLREERQSQLFFENPIGTVLEIFQKYALPLPNFEVIRVGGTDNLPLFKCVLTGKIFDKDFRIESNLSNNKPDAKKDVAVKFLMRLEGKISSKQIITSQEIVVKKKDSLDHSQIPEEITFLKLSDKGQPEEIKISSGTGETLYDWVVRYAIKRPFAMLILLGYRIDNFSGCSWHATIPNGELLLSYNKLGDEGYFEIGFGESKTKAKKDAARKFIENSKLFEWLKKKYEDRLI